MNRNRTSAVRRLMDHLQPRTAAVAFSVGLLSAALVMATSTARGGMTGVGAEAEVAREADEASDVHGVPDAPETLAVPDAPREEARDPGWPREFEVPPVRAGDTGDLGDRGRGGGRDGGRRVERGVGAEAGDGVGDGASDGHIVRIFEPQIETWKDFDRLVFRSAVSVAPKSDPEAVAFGAMQVSAATEVSLRDRLVVLTDRRIESISFTDVPDDEAAVLARAVADAMPHGTQQTIALDRVVAALHAGDVAVRTEPVGLAPPRILWSDRDAILVNFIGKPRFVPVVADRPQLLFAVNTNWDVFLEPATGRHYLLVGDSWLTTTDLERGPWTGANRLPAELSRLPRDDNWTDVLAAIPGTPAARVPLVHVTTTPTELIVTDGQPVLEEIPSTSLMLVTNTDSDLVYDGFGERWYLLAAGRWFRAASLGGPWSEASASLPADFQRIPEDSAAGELLASVPGTDRAREAAILASIPQKAEVDRAAMSLEVTYDGTPEFRPIEGTIVLFAANTGFDVFAVGSTYYCCHEAVWFVAATPTGPWSVADTVPEAIYEIPVDFPRHHVTAVRIYDSTPSTVVIGYTAGYSGATVASTGVVMFGLGVVLGYAIADRDWYWPTYYWPAFYSPYYISYGCGAVWHHGCGSFVSRGWRHGPHGGAGHCASYHATNGRYTRGEARHGPRHAEGLRPAFDPTSATGRAATPGTGPYHRATSAVVPLGDRWVRSAGSSGMVDPQAPAPIRVVQPRLENGRVAAHMKDGDMYAGRDGTLYRKRDSSWQRVGDRPQDAKVAPPGRARTEARTEERTRARTEDAARTRPEDAARTRAGDAARSRAGDAAQRGGTTGARRTPPVARHVTAPPPSVARDATARARAQTSVRERQDFDARGGWQSGDAR
ncbi:MAG: hypothetical protein ACOYMM_13360, partial [Phycisphaerales bacterium]